MLAPDALRLGGTSFLVAALVAFSGACTGSSGGKAGLTGPAVGPTRTYDSPIPAPLQSAPIPTPQGKVPALTGVGATAADWDGNHRMDPQASAGNGYDGASGYYFAIVRTVGGHVTLDPHTGRIVSYNISLASDMTVDQAKALVLKNELPPDASVVYFGSQPNCSQMIVQSAQIGATLHYSGQVYVAFDSSYTHYNPDRVTGILVDTYTSSEVC